MLREYLERKARIKNSLFKKIPKKNMAKNPRIGNSKIAVPTNLHCII